ncbi:hypothetical protein PM082_002076 [Marasmius tenuissimus]|nr:hypothetical protein PM082_002076 [Marasmius tenuissimus]
MSIYLEIRVGSKNIKSRYRKPNLGSVGRRDNEAMTALHEVINSLSTQKFGVLDCQSSCTSTSIQ